MRWLATALPLAACSPGEAPADPPSRPAPVVAEVPPPQEEAPPSEPTCPEAAMRAVATALDVARADGVDPAHLTACRPDAARCGQARAPFLRSQDCQVVVYEDASRWEVAIAPPPATGAPARMEIWVDLDGREAGRKQISGSTWGVTANAAVRGLQGYASHTHGGSPARIGDANFELHNLTDHPVTVTLTETRWLRAFSCELPREERAKPKPAGVARPDGLVDGTMTVTVPAAVTETLSIGHAIQDAYMASCDRFATAATFTIDGETVEVISEHRVVRREPLRRP